MTGFFALVLVPAVGAYVFWKTSSRYSVEFWNKRWVQSSMFAAIT
jgi:hypothetical protein